MRFPLIFVKILLIPSVMMLASLLPCRGELPVAPPIFRNLEAGKPQTVIVYGTSLTHGGAWTVATKRWFDQVYPEKVKFINSGGPGQNSDWGVANLKAKVLDHRPDLVILEFSYNDAHDKFNMPVEQGAANLRKMVETIRSQNPDTAIVLQTMNIGWDAPNGNGSLSHRPNLEQYNDSYRELARELNLPLLDHYVVWKKLKESDPKTYQRYVPDGTHPSSEGSLAVTWPSVKAWLDAGREVAQASKD